MLTNRTAWILTGGLAAVFTLFLLWPLAQIISGGFWVNGQLTFQYFLDVFRNPIYAEGLFNSLRIAAGTTGISLGLALPLAWLSHRFEFRLKPLLSASILTPLALPPFVGAVGFARIFSPYGALNAMIGCGPIDWLGQWRYLGVILLQSLAFYPIVYLNVSAAFANCDPTLEEAAQNLGAGAWTRFRRITCPLIAPGLFAGCTLVFIASFTELGTPLILNYSSCSAVQIYDELKEMSASPFPYALVSVVLAASVFLYALSRTLLGGKAFGIQTKSARQTDITALRGTRGVLAALPFIGVTLLALTPHAGVVLTSFSVPGAWYRSILPTQFTFLNYAEAFGHSMTLSAIRNSLCFSSVAVLINLVLGTTVAWVVVRSKIRARALLDSLAMIPLAVPGLIMAFGFIAVSVWLSGNPLIRKTPDLAAHLDVQNDPVFFLVVAYSIRRLPYMVRAAVAGLEQTPVILEEAAAHLGASLWTTLRSITVPLIAANLIAGLLMSFAFCLLEVSDSLMLAQKMVDYPITKAIFELYQLVGVGQYLAAALGVWAMLFLALTLYYAHRPHRR